MAEYFCLPPVAAKHFPKAVADADADTEIFPCLGTLPMGFTWSLFFAQSINEKCAQQFGSLSKDGLITDKGGPVCLHKSMPPRHYVYVDNGGVLAIAKKEAADRMDMI
eukprot:9450350-Karenia_brevis.AAC.1